MRQVTLDILKFDELSPEVQNKVIERERNDENRLNYDWYDSIVEDAKTCLGYMGFFDVTVGFSGFWSQGDGANFTAEFNSTKIDLEKLQNYAPTIHDKYTQLLTSLNNEVVTANLVKRNRHYSHKNTVCIEMFEADVADSQCNHFEELLERLRLMLCDDIYCALEDEYNHLNSDESIKECLIANDFEFTADGKPYF